MRRNIGASVFLIVTFVVCVGFLARAGNGPPPSNSTSEATIQGLSGVVRSAGWIVVDDTGDAFSQANLEAAAAAGVEAAFLADVQAGSTTSFARSITVTLIGDEGADAGVNPVCLQLGPADQPAWVAAGQCSSSTASITGGCILINAGDVCSFQWRPITSTAQPPTWDLRRPNLWYWTDAGDARFHISYAW